MKLTRRELWRDLLPERDHEVFGRRQNSFQKIDFNIQIPMVALGYNRSVQDVAQLR